jgi:hypothetical protein
MFGVGSGRERRASLALVRNGVERLHASLSHARVAVGVKGPRMVALSAHIADALLVSMLSADEARAVDARSRVDDRHAPTIYSYHRVALDPGGADRVHREMISHGAWSANAAAPDAARLLGSVLRSREGVRAQVEADVKAFPPEWEYVLRPLPADVHDLEEWRDLFRVLAT